MPASAGTPTTQMPPQMAHTPQPPPPSEPTAEAPAAAAAAANRPGIRAQIAENPLTSLLGGIIIILLAATFATSNIRIDDTNDRITRLEDKIDTRFAAQDQKIDTKFAAQDQKIDARFDSLESDVGEINLKLTALIRRAERHRPCRRRPRGQAHRRRHRRPSRRSAHGFTNPRNFEARGILVTQ